MMKMKRSSFLKIHKTREHSAAQRSFGNFYVEDAYTKRPMATHLDTKEEAQSSLHELKTAEDFSGWVRW